VDPERLAPVKRNHQEQTKGFLMLRLSKFSALPLVILIAACANSGANYVPIIDGPLGENYSNDLAQCQGIAASPPAVDGSTAGAAATGAGVAAASSAIFNGTGSGNNIGEAAAVGAIIGVTGNAIQKNQQREVIVRNCMRGRGYNVVG
jgi:hypothetical protein